MTLEELKQREAKLWAELETMRQPYEAKQREWCDVAGQLRKIADRELLKLELLAELEKEKART